MNKIFALFMLSIVFSVPVYAENLSLDDALTYAIERNEDIKISDFSIQQMDSVIREIKSSLYPTVTAGASYMGVVDHSSPNAPTIINPKYNYGGFYTSASIEGSQLLFAFGMIQTAVEAAELSKGLMYTQKDVAMMNLRYSVRNAYFATLVYEENHKIAQESLNNALETKRRLLNSASVRASQSDLIKIDSDIASRKPVVESSKLLMNQGYRLLQVLCVMNEPPTSLTTRYDDMTKPDIDLEKLVEMVEDSPAIKSLVTQIRIDKKTADSKRASNNPTISLAGSYLIGDSSVYPYLRNGSIAGEGYLGIFANIPLYDGGRSSAQARQQDINSYMNTSRLIQTKRQLTTSVKDAYEMYQSKMDILVMDDEAITLALRSYQMSLSRFLNGQTSATELNDVEIGLTSLKMNRISTINAIYSALAQIEQIVGEL